ncbi:S41 family peptidase [Actinomadura chibensis]|uniref:S41 family peptidase n=1 Tax=Actinomadura chibensis TaxID=392828 RepID=A0A5D0NDD7_9ACTN|nr:S41 family peptidase [Actinomadura chibensis]TYB42225.1 S41 family peptidase [Actinomadura chibensis]
MRAPIFAAALSLALIPGPALAAAPAPSASLTGVWRSDGYGMVLTVDTAKATLFQTTSISCLPIDEATRVGAPRPGAAAVYRLSDGNTIRLRPGPRPDAATLHADGSAGDRALARLRRPPAPCGGPQPSGPVGAFDVFWQTFAENYPFFRQRGVDWAAQRRRYRPMVDASTTDERLFRILRTMIEPLGDAHTGIFAGEREFTGLRPGTRPTTRALGVRVKELIDRRDLRGKGRDFASGQLTFAELPGRIGYLRVAGFFGYATGSDFDYAADRARLAEALDAVITPRRRMRGLIIDVRYNPGGYDALGLQLAARLTDRPYLAYRKRARNDPGDPARFTRPQPIMVRPAAAPRYTGPIALLTSDATNSAGETFTQALMGRPGRVVRIGENTQGVFSDVMECPLPNDWSLWVPNEEYLTRDGTTFDGAGVPPHIRTPVFTEEEFAEDRDSAFDRAVAVLGGRA